MNLFIVCLFRLLVLLLFFVFVFVFVVLLLLFADLVLISVVLGFFLHRVESNLLVIFLQGSQILASLGELSFLHTLADVPVDEGALGVHQVKLVVETRPRLGYCCRVAKHRNCAHHFCQVTPRNHCWRLIVDAHLEPCWTPVDELDGPLGLDGGDGSVDIFWYDVAAVQQAAGHIFAVTRIAFDHLVGRFKTSVSDLGYSQLLVVRLLCRNDRRIGGQGEMNPRVRDQVGLEFRQIDVEGAVEPQRRRDAADYLTDQSVEVGVRRPADVQVAVTDVVNGFVVYHEGDVGVFKRRVCRQNSVVRLHNGGGNLGRRVYRKL